MSKFIGRLLNIGVGKESVRGTAVAATYWQPKMELTDDDKVTQVINESSLGNIADAEGANITQQFSEGEIKGRIDDTIFGLWLLASYGGQVAPVVVGGETIVYDHEFNILQNAQHPSLTIAVEEPNATGASGLRYALTAIDKLEVNVELEKYAEFSIAFRGNKNETGTNTPSYATTENIFLPQNGEVKFATDIAGLNAAAAIPVKKVTFSITKNIEDDQVLGDLEAVDRLNKQFTAEGTVELLYDDRSYIDTILLGDLQKAMRIKLTNTAVTLGVSSNPTLTFEFPKIKLSEIARNQANNDLVLQTLSFKAYLSLADAYQAKAYLRNLVSTSY